MNCPKCNEETHGNFCHKCGASLEAPPISVTKCPICGVETEGYFCKECGACVALPPEGVTKCPICGAETEGDFCNECGASLEAPAIDIDIKICPECGAEMQGEFCNECNANIETLPFEPLQNGIMICPICGAETENNFCKICGAKLVEPKSSNDDYSADIDERKSFYDNSTDLNNLQSGNDYNSLGLDKSSIDENGDPLFTKKQPSFFKKHEGSVILILIALAGIIIAAVLLLSTDFRRGEARKIELGMNQQNNVAMIFAEKIKNDY